MALTMSTDRMWTPEDVANYMQLSVQVVRTLTRRGEIKGHKIGKHWRYVPEEVILGGNANDVQNFG